MKIFDRYASLALSVSLLITVVAHAWDYEGHRTVNQLALAALPPDFPTFVREPANAERVAFLSGNPTAGGTPLISRLNISMGSTIIAIWSS